MRGIGRLRVPVRDYCRVIAAAIGLRGFASVGRRLNNDAGRAPLAGSPPYRSDPTMRTALLIALVSLPASAADAVDDTLDKFAKAGQGISRISAELKESLEDSLVPGAAIIRTGTMQVLRGAQSRVKVEIVGGRTKKLQESYLFDGERFWKMNFQGKVQVHGWGVKPEDRGNIFKIGRGPFPLPIGQPADEVRAMFTVEMLETKDPKEIRLKLVPKANSPYKREFKEFEIKAVLATGVPHEVISRNNAGQEKSYQLLNLKTNADAVIAAGAFDPPDIKMPPFDKAEVNIEP